jgi:hypothetical protein
MSRRLSLRVGAELVSLGLSVVPSLRVSQWQRTIWMILSGDVLADFSSPGSRLALVWMRESKPTFLGRLKLFGSGSLDHFDRIRVPNTALEPTPFAPRICRFEFLVGVSRSRRGSALGR